MNQSLYIGRSVLEQGEDRLRQILIDHVQSERAASELLVSLAQARGAGELSHCVVYPRFAGYASDRETPEWQVRVAYTPPSISVPGFTPAEPGAPLPRD